MLFFNTFAMFDIDRYELYGLEHASWGSYLSNYLSPGISLLLKGYIRHFGNKDRLMFISFDITNLSKTAHNLLLSIMSVYII